MENPFFVYEITQRCNLNCIYCYNVWNETDYPEKEPGLDEIKFLFNKLLDETNIDQISISGGEPMLHKDIYEVAAFLKEKKIKTGITTSGILLDDASIKKLIENGINYFEISLDSLTKDVFQQMTTSNNLEKVKKSILSIKKHNAVICVSIVITAKF